MTTVLKIDEQHLVIRIPDDAPLGDVFVKSYNGSMISPTYTKIGCVESRITEADIPEYRVTYDDYAAIQKVKDGKTGAVIMNKETLMFCLRALARSSVTGSKIHAIKMLRQYMSCGLKEAKDFVDSL